MREQDIILKKNIFSMKIGTSRLFLHFLEEYSQKTNGDEEDEANLRSAMHDDEMGIVSKCEGILNERQPDIKIP